MYIEDTLTEINQKLDQLIKNNTVDASVVNENQKSADTPAPKKRGRGRPKKTEEKKATVSVADVRKVLLELGAEKALEILEELGLEKLSDADAEELPQIMKTAKEMLKEIESESELDTNSLFE